MTVEYFFINKFTIICLFCICLICFTKIRGYNTIKTSFKKFCLHYSSFGGLWLSNDFCRHFEYIHILDENGEYIHHYKLTNEIIDNLTDKQVIKMINDGYSSKYIYTIELHDDVFIKSIFKKNTPKKVKLSAKKTARNI